MQLYRRLLAYAWPYKWIFLLSLIGMLITAVTEPATAAVMKPLMDEGFIAKDPAAIAWLPLIFVCLFLLRAIGQFSAQYAVGWIGRRVIFDIRKNLFHTMINLPTVYYDANASGSLISKMLYDAEQIASTATKAIFILIKDSLTVIGLIVWMAILNWQLTLIFAVVAPVLAVFVRAMSRRFRKTARNIQQSIGGISNVTQEATTGHRVIKAFTAQDIENRSFEVVNERNRRQATRKAALAAAAVPVMEILAAVAIALVITYALHQSAAGALTPGDFTSYFASLIMIMGPAKRLTKVNEIIQTGLAAAQSVFSLLDEPLEPDSGTRNLGKVKGRIDYSNVSMRYASSENLALDRISFSIQPGETVALVGGSGSGKTTMANLLPRFYFVDEGEILIDGVNINELKLANLRGHIALVSQETVMFNDTVRNNIVYGGGEVDETRLQEAMRAAHVTEFVEEWSDGLDTEVGEKGVRLSGGQRQRLAIARALYKNAPILILDEATSALDSETERFVQEAMQQLMRNRTTLVIAHRLSTIESADKIIVLAQGKVVESGTHAQLLAKQGAYALLYKTHIRNEALDA